MPKGLQRSQKRGAPRDRELYRIDLPELDFSVRVFKKASDIGYGFKELFDFPQGHVFIHGVVGSFRFDASGESGVVDAWEGDVAIGTGSISGDNADDLTSSTTVGNIRQGVAIPAATNKVSSIAANAFTKLGQGYVDNVDGTLSTIDFNLRIDTSSITANFDMQVTGELYLLCNIF